MVFRNLHPLIFCGLSATILNNLAELFEDFSGQPALCLVRLPYLTGGAADEDDRRVISSQISLRQRRIILEVLHHVQ